MEKGRLEDSLEDIKYLLDTIKVEKYPRFSKLIERRIGEGEIALRIALELNTGEVVFSPTL